MSFRGQTVKANEIESRILAALDKLARSATLLEVLAERTVWDGGIEKVFQGLFLWAFNGLDLCTYCYLAPEINLGSEIGLLDYLVFKSSPPVDSKVESGRATGDELLRLASGFIEVKDIHNDKLLSF